MKNRNLIQSYINNFRKNFTKYLKANTGIRCTVFPSEKDGAILEINIGPNIENADVYTTISGSVQSALGNINQNAFGGNLNGFVFKGTNTIIENNRIIFIKDDSEQEWSELAADNDVKQIIDIQKKRIK